MVGRMIEFKGTIFCIKSNRIDPAKYVGYTKHDVNNSQFVDMADLKAQCLIVN